MLKWVEQREASGEKLRLMLDFHSTFEDLFYTQPVSDEPVDFASLWLSASAARLPDFPLKHMANEVSEQPNSKNYFYTSRGIPAITYESGDETGREQIENAAVIFAEEMMRVMLHDTNEAFLIRGFREPEKAPPVTAARYQSGSSPGRL